ncbi:ABC transporter substrate-binding protein [Micromonospora inositola]|uniref:ABC-type Fe3+ transport system, substrate-binding protein n=1 Tax=Micromonospora inositola TaxID=47865 RepID=A0A1C5K5S3_9ACTN|nr:extracellular solute-binding protein [Micromonospora inositola]SCG77961.1 ABC-type Fe3+ transport system, substrate-binding protein [Micromonospora inositola]
MSIFPVRAVVANRRRAAALVLAVVLAGALAACGDDAKSGAGSAGTSSQADDFGLGADVLAKARDEGSVNHVGSTLNPDIAKQMQNIMKDRYGIKLSITPLRAAETLERLRAEQRAGNRTVDTVGLGVQYGEIMKKEGLSEAFKPTGFPGFLTKAAEFDEDGFWYPFQLTLYGVAVNKSKLDPSKVSDWWSLADGSITEPVIFADPLLGSGGFTWAVAMEGEEKYGASYLNTLGERSNVQLGPVHADNVARLVRGDVAAYFPFGAFSIGEIKGSGRDRVELVFPGGKPYIGPANLSMTKGAPHANAAKVWMSFLMSEEGQTLVAKGGLTPARSNIKVPDPKSDMAHYTEVIETRLDNVIANHEQVEAFSQKYFGR